MLSPEQIYLSNRYAAIDRLAEQAGFDDQAFTSTEFSLLPLFEIIVEACAQQAELAARNCTGEDNKTAGCFLAAKSIRSFGKTIGNLPELKTALGPIKDL